MGSTSLCSLRSQEKDNELIFSIRQDKGESQLNLRFPKNNEAKSFHQLYFNDENKQSIIKLKLQNLSIIKIIDSWCTCLIKSNLIQQPMLNFTDLILYQKIIASITNRMEYQYLVKNRQSLVDLCSQKANHFIRIVNCLLLEEY